MSTEMSAKKAANVGRAYKQSVEKTTSNSCLNKKNNNEKPRHEDHSLTNATTRKASNRETWKSMEGDFLDAQQPRAATFPFILHFHVCSRCRCTSWFPFHVWFLVGCTGCDSACNRFSSRCVRRGSILVSRFAGLRRAALSGGWDPVLRGWFPYGLALLQACLSPAGESKWSGTSSALTLGESVRVTELVIPAGMSIGCEPYIEPSRFL